MESSFKNNKYNIQDLPYIGWFFAKGYMQGVFWAIMICVVSVTNDVLMRFLGEDLNFIEIVFFRFLFSMIVVIPLMLRHSKGVALFKTTQAPMHFWRAIVGAAALGLTCYSVNIMPLAENTTIMFAEPLFFLPLAALLLNEKVDRSRWIATMIGFMGLLVIFQPGAETFRLVAFVPMTAAILFAILNVMAKKMIAEEHSYTMLFYFGLGTTVCAAIPLCFIWKTPTLYQIVLLIGLGIGANLIQVCLFRAFAATDASALTPFRYCEFIISSTFGFLFFGQIPTLAVVAGATIIIISNLYITHVETKKEKHNNHYQTS